MSTSNEIGIASVEVATKPNFLLRAIAGFYAGFYLALIPCLDNPGGSYCNVHGFGAIPAGLLLGVLCAYSLGRLSVNVLRKLIDGRRDDT